MFQIGDRVFLLCDTPEGQDALHRGDQGTVCDVPSFAWAQIGVRWDTSSWSMHCCHEHCDNNHGWYVDINIIKLVDDECEEIESPLDVSDLI